MYQLFSCAGVKIWIIPKKYCVHNSQAIEERIKDWRERLEGYDSENDWPKDMLRESLRSEIKWKNTSLDDHCTWCLGNQYHLLD